MVGIFWVVDGKILTDCTPLINAEPYGDCLTHGRSHSDHWDRLVRTGAVTGDDYEEHPRGRVVYNVKTQQFTVYADRCILRNKPVLKQVIEEMHLPGKKTVTSTDEHYRCFRCLRTTGS